MKNTTTTKAIRGAVVVGALALAAMGCGGGGGGKRRGDASGLAVVGTRVLAGSLVEARTGHQATAVEDGLSVLITGGRTLTAPASNTAELWTAGRSVPLPASMLEARAGHRAIALQDGRVWIVGGHDARGVALDTTELFDPVTGAFTAGPRLSAPRDEAFVTPLSGGGWVIGLGRGQSSIEAWTPALARDGVAALSSAGIGRRGATAVELAGALYVSGGTLDSGEPGRPVWIDPAGQVTAARGKAHNDGEHHVLGGTTLWASLDGATREVWTVAGTFNGKPWQHLQRVRDGVAFEHELGGVTFGRERATVVALGRGILVAGGTLDGAAQDAVEVLQAGGNGRTPPLAIARHDAEGTLLADGSVLITGGLGRDGLPVGVSELIVPLGVDAPSAEALYAKARAEKAERDRLIAEVARLEAELTRKQAELAAAEARVRDLEAKYARANADLAHARADVASARADVAAARKRVAELEAQLAAARTQAKAPAPATPAPTGGPATFQIGAVTTLPAGSPPIPATPKVGAPKVSTTKAFGPQLIYPVRDQVPADSKRR